ncbi:Concanavalin A-like lectin/glucanases superfamily protein [Actinacidiphila yanglinensis]|uniref:Concanavalin A-like lectin/glucanases superfamily protein n=1 Tax=Actinacidiphila yanglinensis TaxID=310779 RepID=A0A1H5T131_9ACTN|nr:LamG-like jellyroll fold domain-containing protein [Actinacidiphila yanglinensis]SEF56485.1 Concanavalin A-like lectin/glucanases superfamily protein [Actinacidiphila yanglinensis]
MRTWPVLTAALALAAAALGAVGSPSATALQAPVGITADNLSTYQTNGVVWAMAQAGGDVFAGGTFSAIRPPGAAAGTSETAVANFASFDAATGQPAGCQLNFTVGSNDATVRALAVSPDGRTLYAGGFFGTVGGTGVSSLAAIDLATCTVSTTFRPAVSGTVRTIVATDDAVYFGGDVTSVGGTTRHRYAAVSASDGSLLPWAPNVDNPGRALALTPDGQDAILGGDFNTVDGVNSHSLAVVDASTGALVKAYPTGFIDATSVTKDIYVDPASNSFYTANEGTGGGVFDGRIRFRLTDFNQVWRDTCLGATQAVAVYQTVLYSGSHAHDCSSMGEYPDETRKHLLAESVDDPHLLSFFPDTNDGIGEKIGPRVMAFTSVGSTEYLWVGGEFTTVNGGAQQGLTRFASGPDTGAPTLPQTSVTSIDPGSVQVSWQSSTDNDDGTLTYRVYRNGSTTPIYTTTGASLPWVRPQITFTDTSVTPGVKYTYRVSASDGTNTSALSPNASATVPTAPEAYPTQVLADGASLYWRYDAASGSYNADSSASNDSGISVGGPVHGVTPGAVPGSKAYTFNGSSQWTYSDRLHPQPTQYSVEAWFRTTSTSGGKIIGFGSNTTEASANYDKHVYMTNSGQLIFGVYTGATQTITAPGSYNDGAWHQVVATQGSDGSKLYVDGVLKASNAFMTNNQAYSGYWRVGGDNLSGWPSQPSSAYFGGSIDEAAVYPGVLTAAQVANHYALGTAG